MQTSFYKKPRCLQLAVHLLLKCEHEPQKGLDRGQCRTGLDSLKKETGISLQSLRTAMTTLEKMGFMERKKEHEASLIILPKYHQYQKSPRQSTGQLTPQTNTPINTPNVLEKNEKSTPLSTPLSNKQINTPFPYKQEDKEVTTIAKAPKPLQPHQAIVEAYFANRGQPLPKGPAYGRWAKAAVELLTLAGKDVDRAKQAIEGIKEWLEALGRPWTLETVCKHYANWAAKLLTGKPPLRKDQVEIGGRIFHKSEVE